MRNITVAILFASTVLGALLGVPVTVKAQSTAALSQGFATSERSLSAGAIVSFERGSNARVQLANIDSAQDLAGVTSDHPLISLSTESNKAQVVISGTTPVLVSDINGDIKAGDKITASPVNGIGMKATQSTQVVGTAQEDLAAVPTHETRLTDVNQHERTIHVGTLKAQINITYYAVANDPTSLIPPFLQQLANNIAGHEVAVLRVVISLILLLVGFFGAGILLYSAVRSSIISIGRNPLSESAVRQSLLQVGLIAFAILLAAAIAVYVLLKV